MPLRVLSGSVLVMIGAHLAGASAVTLHVKEPSGVARRGWPVTSGAPFARGELREGESIALFTAGGEETPLQHEVLARWPDGSVRWLLLDFQADVAAGGEEVFMLRHGPQIRARKIENPIRVTKLGPAVEIHTGPLRFRVGGEGPGILGDLWLDRDGDGSFAPEERLMGPVGARIVLTTPGGQSFEALAPSAEVKIEQAGPLRACVRVEAIHGSARGTRLRSIVRIHAYRGRPFIRISHTFINETQSEVMAKVDALDWIFSLKDGGEAATVLDGREGVAGRLFQIDDRRYEIDAEVAGRRAAGWAGLGSDKGGLAVGVREFWQNWPKSLELNNGALTVGLCPRFDDGLYDGKPLEEENKLYYYLRGGVYTFKVGLARTHDLWANFFAGRPDVAGLSDFFQAAEDLLLATCEPAHVSSTRAMGTFPPADPNRYAGYDAWLDRAFEAHLERREREREWGMLNYGDWFGERNVNWGNLEYDLAHGFFIQYLRTGDRRFFERAEQAARHHIDVDVVHATNPHLQNPWGPPPQVGEIWLHGLNHTGGYYENAPLPVSRVYQLGMSTNFGHVWVSGDLDYYHLTGDRRALEVSLRIADAMVRNCPTPYSNHIRTQGWPMILVLDAYEATGDPKYLDAATSLWRTLKENLDEDRGWVVRLAKGHCLHADQDCYGNVSFMMGLTLSALSRYHRITRDPEVLRAISVGLDQMIRECWIPRDKAFRYTACPLSSVNGTFLSLGMEAFAYEGLLTGNREHLGILREGFPVTLKQADRVSWGKSLGMLIHFAPHGLAALEN